MTHRSSAHGPKAEGGLPARVTLRAYCAAKGLSYHTVRLWRSRGAPAIDPVTGQEIPFPHPVGTWQAVPGRIPRDLYDRDQLDTYVAAKRASLQADRPAPAGRSPGAPRRQRPTRAPRAAAGTHTVERVTAILRAAVAAQVMLRADAVAEALAVTPVVAQRHIDAAAPTVITEFRLRSRADLAARLPGGDTARNRDRVRNAASGRDAPRPVLRWRRTFYYLPADSETLLRRLT